ncbi:MAG: hypothetical protein SGJ27_17540 [Candidatus Melainabacteria bacterium]|nr:hypothetical protein [Candidatus Melainabacteria bacterium]
MKYLHSGYILFCEKAEHDDCGMLNVYGLFDVLEVNEIPTTMNCAWVVGFGTPYERRQYKGELTVENPKGELVLSQEFAANDPNDIFKGHYVFKPEINIDQDGAWTVTVTLRNWKDENMWDIQRQFWCTQQTDSPPDP